MIEEERKIYACFRLKVKHSIECFPPHRHLSVKRQLEYRTIFYNLWPTSYFSIHLVPKIKVIYLTIYPKSDINYLVHKSNIKFIFSPIWSSCVFSRISFFSWKVHWLKSITTHHWNHLDNLGLLFKLLFISGYWCLHLKNFNK